MFEEDRIIFFCSDSFYIYKKSIPIYPIYGYEIEEFLDLSIVMSWCVAFQSVNEATFRSSRTCFPFRPLPLILFSLLAYLGDREKERERDRERKLTGVKIKPGEIGSLSPYVCPALGTCTRVQYPLFLFISSTNLVSRRRIEIRVLRLKKLSRFFSRRSRAGLIFFRKWN